MAALIVHSSIAFITCSQPRSCGRISHQTSGSAPIAEMSELTSTMQSSGKYVMAPLLRVLTVMRVWLLLWIDSIVPQAASE